MRKKFLNRIMKLIFAVLLSAGIFAGSIPVNAAAIKDISKASSYAKEAIQWMTNNNVITGDEYGCFNPGKNISRAELVTIIVKALNIDMTNLPETPTYSDVPAKHWAFRYVEAASRAGIVSGIGNGKFGANDMSTREQVTVMLLNNLSLSGEAVLAGQGLDGLAKFIDAENMSDWAKGSIQFAVSNSIMSGTGSNTFSPAGKATKEQIAVILYNFMKNSEKIYQSAEQLRKPVIKFNGDILKLTQAPVLENGQMLVPAEAFIKMEANVSVDEARNSVVIKNAAGNKNIFLSTGNNTAYVNYTGSGNPFNAPEAAGNAITLAAAPKLSGNDVLVPGKAVAEAIGMSAEINVKTGLTVIKDTSAVNNPLLFKAMKNMLDFKGEYRTSMDMSLIDTILKEKLVGLTYSMEGANNGPNSTANTKITTADPEYGEESEEYQVIKIGQQLYSKDMDTGVWSQITEEEAIEQGIPYYDSEADKAETQKFLSSYGKLNITHAGKAVVYGEEVARYQIKAGKEILSDLIPSDLLGGAISIEDIYNKGFDIKMEIFVNDKGQLVKQVMKLTAGMEQDGFSMELNMTALSEFSKIGTEIEIVSPL